MTNEISSYNFNTLPIRAYINSGNIWFCVPDVRKALKIPQNSRMIQNLAKGFVKRELQTNGGKQKVSFCCERDLYKITVRSNSPAAEPFVDWVCGEVLPSIRRTGAYVADKPVTVSEHTRALPSGKKEIVLSEKAKQEIGGIVKACLGTSGKTSCALDVDVLKNLIREVLREELAGFLLKDGVTATEPFNGNVTADGLPAANWVLSIVHGASALQSIIGQMTDKQKEAVKLLA